MCILMYVIACRNYTHIYSLLFPFFQFLLKCFPLFSYLHLYLYISAPSFISPFYNYSVFSLLFAFNNMVFKYTLVPFVWNNTTHLPLNHRCLMVRWWFIW